MKVQRLMAQMHGQRDGTGNVRLEPPPDNLAMVAEGQALARSIQSELAALDRAQTLEETTQALRGRSWS